MSTIHAELAELAKILGSRDSIEVTHERVSVVAQYKFSWFPQYKGRVTLGIHVPRVQNGPSTVFDLSHYARACYPQLASLKTQRNLEWKAVLDTALSYVRVWEDVLLPPSDPTFCMSVLESKEKDTLLRDSLLASVKAFVLRGMQNGERSGHWMDYESNCHSLRGAGFTPEELSMILDLHVTCDRNESSPQRYDWYFCW